MVEDTKCECGHQNPLGTVLCESCGKPLQEDAMPDSGPLEMRYDGVLRRSQRENPTIIDRIWKFFSSVKVAIYLIIMTLIGAAIGTIFPQENMFLGDVKFSTLYEEKYGTAGRIYYLLGLSHTYDSIWFKGLLVMIGTSLVVCSLDRVLPLYRALNKQSIRKHLGFLTRQRVTYQGSLIENGQTDETQWLGDMEKELKRRRYRVHTEDGALLAEKYRFSRWGPYINHIGLIVFLLAVLARSIPGWYMDQYVGFMEGRIVKIPETPYYLENKKFTVEFYSEDELAPEFRGQGKTVPKFYETQAVLYICESNCGTGQEPKLKEVASHNIQVNKPLVYKGFKAY